MTTFSWLHLTDLHLGMAQQDWMLQQVREAFYEDLELQQKTVGPFDLVIFTGDLTYSAKDTEFTALDEFLRDLRRRIVPSDKSPSPILVAVPGNHDLTWDIDTDPDPLVELPLRNLRRWYVDNDAKVQDNLWKNDASVYRKLLKRAFQPYVDWWCRGAHGFAYPSELKDGLLPGDFSGVVIKDGARLGIVGLNSAFLQLRGGMKEGELALHTLQFQAVCGGNGPTWAKNCDAALLLTHHPGAWLDPKSRDDHLLGNIYSPGRFVAHLYGHMHQGESTRAGAVGSHDRRFLQGTSLFGLETWTGGREDRLYGYSIGRIDLDAEPPNFRMWPRRAYLDGDKQYTFNDDAFYGRLQADRGTRSETFPRLRPKLSVAPSQPSDPPWAPQSPTHPYDGPPWYVAHGRNEKLAMGVLGAPGGTIVVYGPAQSGKAWFVKHVEASLRRQAPKLRYIELDLGNLGYVSSGEDDFLHAIGTGLARAAGRLPPEAAPAPWPPGSGREMLTKMMADAVLPGDGPLLIVIKRLDAVVGDRPELLDPVLNFIRSWGQLASVAPWSSLRLVLVVSTTAARDALGGSAVYNTTLTVRIDGLTQEQVEKLAEVHRLHWTKEEIRAVREYLGGNPFLIRLAMFDASLNGTSVPEILDHTSNPGRDLWDHAVALVPPLGVEQRDEVQRLASGSGDHLDRELFVYLRDAGVVKEEGGHHTFTGEIFRRYFAGL